MNEIFVQKKLEVIRSPRGAVERLRANQTGGFLSDKDVKEEAGILLGRLCGHPELLFYDEDVDGEEGPRMSWRSSFLKDLVDFRARMFEALSAEVPTIMMKQTRFKPPLWVRDDCPRWKDLAGVSPQIMEKCSVKDVNSLQVKRTPFSVTRPFVLHTGPGGVESPFLAEEHVFSGEARVEGKCSTITLAPDQSETFTLDECEKKLSRAASLRVVWHAMRGCETLHRAGFVHGDVKPGNIFVVKKRGRLFDFDLAIPRNMERSVSGGTPGYLDEPYTLNNVLRDPRGFIAHNGEDLQAWLTARDVFAFGMTIGDFVAQSPEWKNIFFNSKKAPLEEHIRKNIPSGAYRELVLDMTHLKRSERPALPEAINRLGRLIGLGEVKF